MRPTQGTDPETLTDARLTAIALVQAAVTIRLGDPAGVRAWQATEPATDEEWAYVGRQAVSLLAAIAIGTGAPARAITEWRTAVLEGGDTE